MNPSQRFSILTFPQFFDGERLGVNIVFLPRDQNPLADAIVLHSTVPDAPPFADARPTFVARIFDTTAVFPHNHPPVPPIGLITEPPSDPRAIFEALAPQLDIVNLNSTNSDADLALISAHHKPPLARSTELTVRKYLPHSYRRAFNFTSPRHRNLLTDDSYRCAIKDSRLVAGFKRSPNTVSWGKVFAYLMRQPLLARHAGLAYRTSFAVEVTHFPNGGWLYVDLAEGSDYRPQLDTDHTFVRRYAARIPALVPGQPRQVFAAVLFPVLFKSQAADPDPSPAGSYDRIFIEAAEYDDGFAKIVHCRQPPHRDRLEEEPDGAYPVKDLGIETGWEDETITQWYIRQMEANPAGDMDGRIDAPLGVFGYALDVRETAEPENPWQSLNQVESRQPLLIPRPADPARPIELGEFRGELPYQVYPMQVDGRRHLSYWLPMYFANWLGHSMVLPDPDAAAIYQTSHAQVKPDPEAVLDPHDPDNPEKQTGTGVTGPARNQLNQLYRAADIATDLRYGRNYELRVRMRDLSGGGPDPERSPYKETASDVATCRFRRFISPNQPRIQEMGTTGDHAGAPDLVNSDTPARIERLRFQRPKLGYPAVVFTGKYAAPIQRLIAQSNLGIAFDQNDPAVNAEHRVGLGIADPDVDRIEITVEIATLKLDKLDSISGKEDYVHLYTTTRAFPEINSDDDYEAVLELGIQYRDVAVLHSGDEVDLVNDLGLDDDIDNLVDLFLPTGRTARLTIRALCEEKDANEDYYGVIDLDNKLLDNRYGETFEIMAYAPSADERQLLIQTPGVPAIQGIFLQSDVATAGDGKLKTLLFGRTDSDQRDNVQQLADQLKLAASGMTLGARKGERVAFGCSSRIRHTLAPDGSSVSFASKGDLIDHWLCCINFELDRDWMWDALENRAFVVRRTKRFTRDAQPVDDNVVAGDIEVVRTASFEALHNPDRSASRIVFIDAVEPKRARANAAPEPAFPDTIELTYTLETRFKSDHADQSDPARTLSLRLPITTPPAQVPRIVSAGIALSPYVRNERYSASQVRKRHLWIEFAEPVNDPQDTYFARVLAVAPDQLLSNNNPELLAAPDEPALPIAPEHMRVVTEGATNDLAGLRAMQPMEKSTSSDRHYLLPLPPGLHADADELFGFFTYELRLGHYRNPGTGEMVWSTAQGRYGRPLRATGIQHPAPTLTCVPNRDDKKLWVMAPYAVAVHKGKNVTAVPPRTQLWALLYAQVKQADNRDFRNILLDDRQLDWRFQVETAKKVEILDRYTDEELNVLRTIAFRNFAYEIDASILAPQLKLVDFSSKNSDATRYGTTVWSQHEVLQLLANLGLPPGSPLSVLVVEILPQIRNILEQVSDLGRPRVADAAGNLAPQRDQARLREILRNPAGRPKGTAAPRGASPLSDRLGHHRILRTSPLTEVPEICLPR